MTVLTPAPNDDRHVTVTCGRCGYDHDVTMAQIRDGTWMQCPLCARHPPQVDDKIETRDKEKT